MRFYETKKKPVKGLSGGEGGIRTHGGFAPTPDFESGTFDHSATSPTQVEYVSRKPHCLESTWFHCLSVKISNVRLMSA